jgi:hypothetical protein
MLECMYARQDIYTEDNAEKGKRGGSLHSPAMEQMEETSSKLKAIIRT